MGKDSNSPSEFITSIFYQPVPASDAAYVEWSIEATKSILFYFSLVQVPLAILLNSVQIWIFMRKKFRKSTMSFYYIVSAVS